jgi:hypothetical protein
VQRVRALRSSLVLLVILSACGASGSASPPDGGGGSGGSTGTGGTGAVAGNGGSGAAGDGSAAWRPFADTSPWNTPIAANASVDPDSAALITDFSTIPGQTAIWINIQDYSVPVYWIDSTATANVTVTASLGGTGFRTGAASDSVAGGMGLAPIPAGALPAAGTDRHLAIVDKLARIEWGFWDATMSGAGWTAGQASTMDLAGSGVRPPERNNPWWAGHGPRACGYPLIAGLITKEDIGTGSIEHALVIAYPHIRSRYYTPPASTAQGTTSDALATRGIPCGGRIQLDPTLDVAALGLSPTPRMIVVALQRYGAFVGDYSGAVSLYADSSPDAQALWDTLYLPSDALSAIPLSRFRVLTLGTAYDNMN